jgi:hypothetical protein
MRSDTFTFKCDKDERKMIALLASRLQRQQSDAVRFVIREAVKALEPDTTTTQNTPQAVTHGA